MTIILGTEADVIIPEILLVSLFKYCMLFGCKPIPFPIMGGWVIIQNFHPVPRETGRSIHVFLSKTKIFPNSLLKDFQLGNISFYLAKDIIWL